MTLTDREKALVEAARMYVDDGDPPTMGAYDKLVSAVRAYDPPKTIKRDYIMPAFNELSPELRSAIWDSFSGGATHSAGNFYNALRECILLAKDSDETNVIKFPGAQQFPKAGKLLDELMKHRNNLTSLIICGHLDDGREVFALACEDAATVNWLIDVAKSRMMNSYKRGTE
mgnify:CR=1 FL=1